MNVAASRLTSNLAQTRDAFFADHAHNMAEVIEGVRAIFEENGPVQSLLALGLPSFDTVLNNYRFSYSCLENEYCNPIIVQIKEFH